MYTRLIGVPTAVAAPMAAGARRSPGASALVVLLLYAGLSLAIFGRELVSSPSHTLEGMFGRDQSFYVWSLAWLARSLTRPENPFLTHEVFAPAGFNLAWASSMFGPGLIVVPLTLVAGAVVSFNVLALAAPATAAWTAFLLCRHVCASTPAAFAGGLLYGFGSYECGEMVDHLSLALIAVPPLAVLLVLRRYQGLARRSVYIGGLGALIALQLWTATEVLASMVLFGLLALLLAVLLCGRGSYGRLREMGADTLAALALALLLAVPLLVYVVGHENPLSGIRGADAGADLANFIIPTRATWLHGTGSLARTAASMRGNISEQLAYLGLPLLCLLVAFGVEFRRSRLARFLLLFIALSIVLSLGAHPYVAGSKSGVVLPWYLFSRLPALRFAIPGRFVLYTWLAVAVAAAFWLAKPSRAPARWALFVLAAAFLVPELSGGSWATAVDSPPLLRPAALARYVPGGATVLALPFGNSGESMLWQQQADFRFRLAGGYVSVSLPRSYERYRHLVSALQGGRVHPSTHAALCSFLRMTGARVILLRENAPGSWSQLLDPLRVRPLRTGGLYVYRLTAGSVAAACGAPGGNLAGKLQHAR